MLTAHLIRSVLGTQRKNIHSPALHGTRVRYKNTKREGTNLYISIDLTNYYDLSPARVRVQDIVL